MVAVARGGALPRVDLLPQPRAAREGDDPERHAVGAVLHACSSTTRRRSATRRSELLDILCVLYGGIEAERLLLGDVSTGASAFGDPRSDLSRASDLASIFVEGCGMSNLAAPLRTFRDHEGKRDVLSGSMAEAIDRQVNTIIVESQARAAAILAKHKADLVAVRDELLEKKTIEGGRVHQIIDDLRQRYPNDVGAAGTGNQTRRRCGHHHCRGERCAPKAPATKDEKTTTSDRN